MANYTPYQVYERIPFHGKQPDRAIFTDSFMSPAGNDAGIAIELRITSPPEAVTTLIGVSGAGFPSFEIAGAVNVSLPAWRTDICGTEIKYGVRIRRTGLNAVHKVATDYGNGRPRDLRNLFLELIEIVLR